MSCALEAASDEAMEHIENSAVKHADETSFLRDSLRCSAWVFASALVSVYPIVDDGKRISLRANLRKVKEMLVLLTANAVHDFAIGTIDIGRVEDARIQVDGSH